MGKPLSAQLDINALCTSTGDIQALDSRDYVYIRLDPKEGGTWTGRKTSDGAVIRAHTEAARLDGFTVQSRLVISERIGASVAASGRPVLMRFIRQLKPGDAVVVFTLDGFGRDASDILKTIGRIHEMGAEPFCASLGRDNLFLDSGFIKIMEAMAALERSTGVERKQARAKGLGVAGARLGRPPSLDDATQAAVRADLEAGDAIAVVARRYNTSRQTILRLRDA